MSRIARWAALAGFCAAFGFGGSVGGIALMQDDLRGQTGEPGLTGRPGSQGPAGPAGPAANTVGLSFDLNQLDRRVDDLESAATPGPGCAMLTRLVTDVSTFGTFDPVFDVSRTPFPVCVNPG